MIFKPSTLLRGPLSHTPVSEPKEVPRPLTGGPRRRLRVSTSLLPDLIAIGLALFVGVIVGRIEAGSGDYGQWLMVSRHYLGLDVPDYRDPAGVPLLMPLLLALTQRVVSDPLIAIQVFKGALAAAFVLSFYTAGAGLYGHRWAGLLSAILAFLVTDRFLEPFAFGGLPQTLSLVFMALGIGALGRAGRAPRLEMHWWTLGAIGITLAGMSHVGTGIIAAAAGATTAFIGALQVPGIRLSERAKALLPGLAALIVLAVYWRLVLPTASQGYANNPASLNYRGPGLVWDLLKSYTPTMLVLWLGVSSLVAGSLDEIARRRIGAHLMAAGWAVSIWGLFLFSVVTGAATDYPRFVPLILAPLTVAAAGGLAAVARALAGLLRTPLVPRMRIALPLVLVGLLAFGFGPRTLERHGAESNGYLLSDKKALAVAAGWLDSNIDEEVSVLTPTREGKWVEGLTGRAAVFEIPVRFSFRPSERARSVAAEALLRSTGALINEHFFIKYTDSKAGAQGSVPREPRIAMNHGGEYLDFARILSTESQVFAADDPDKPLATLNGLQAVRADGSESIEEVWLRTLWEGKRRNKNVSYTRTASLARGDPAFNLIDEVTTEIPIHRIQVQVRLVSGITATAVEIGENQVDLYLPKAGSTQPHLRLIAPEQTVEIERAVDGVIVRALGANRLHLRFEAISAGKAIYPPDLLLPDELVAQYQVGAILLKRDPASDARISRLATLGFNPGLEAAPYVVLVKDTAAVLTKASVP